MYGRSCVTYFERQSRSYGAPYRRYDVPSNKTTETIAKSILNLAVSSKLTTCEVSISNICTSNNMFKREIWDKFTEFTFLNFFSPDFTNKHVIAG